MLPPIKEHFYFANEGIKEITENTLTIANDQFKILKVKKHTCKDVDISHVESFISF